MKQEIFALSVFFIVLLVTTSPAQPADFPEIETQVLGNTADGRIFLSPSLPVPYKLFVLDNDGNPLKYIEAQPAYRYTDFKQLNDTVFAYSFDPPWGEPAYYLTDTLLNNIDSFRAGNGKVLDFHDFILLENGHALVLVYDQQTMDMSQYVTGGNPNALVTGLIIQEVDNQQQVFWEWKSWDHFQITDGISSGANNLIDFTLPAISYIHANSLDIDSQGNILLSSRNMHEVTKIDRSTGDIIWRLGGKNNQFTFINDTLGFTDQHDARWVGDNRITVFDNGNFHVPKQTRVLEYELDEVNKTATLVWEFPNPYGAVSTSAGNAQRLANGNTFIGWGTRSPFSAPAITEVQTDGAIVFELTFLLNGQPSNQSSYRSFRFPLPEPMATRVGESALVEPVSVKISPNPASDHLSLVFNKPITMGKLEIFNRAGIMVFSGALPAIRQNEPYSLPIGFLEDGLYFYSITSNSFGSTGKLLKL
ncbi:MAG: aryl-sulfate sulfotransferase [Saprospiraceae bacterium]